MEPDAAPGWTPAKFRRTSVGMRSKGNGSRPRGLPPQLEQMQTSSGHRVNLANCVSAGASGRYCWAVGTEEPALLHVWEMVRAGCAQPQLFPRLSTTLVNLRIPLPAIGESYEVHFPWEAAVDLPLVCVVVPKRGGQVFLVQTVGTQADAVSKEKEVPDTARELTASCSLPGRGVAVVGNDQILTVLSVEAVRAADGSTRWVWADEQSLQLPRQPNSIFSNLGQAFARLALRSQSPGGVQDHGTTAALVLSPLCGNGTLHVVSKSGAVLRFDGALKGALCQLDPPPAGYPMLQQGGEVIAAALAHPETGGEPSVHLLVVSSADGTKQVSWVSASGTTVVGTGWDVGRTALYVVEDNDLSAVTAASTGSRQITAVVVADVRSPSGREGVLWVRRGDGRTEERRLAGSVAGFTSPSTPLASAVSILMADGGWRWAPVLASRAHDA
eukprot:Hpha_TRINITY_DN17545_c0_g1::TRINITY_DN17545_c0_g1_i1::g.92525::m.92525